VFRNSCDVIGSPYFILYFFISLVDFFALSRGLFSAFYDIWINRPSFFVQSIFAVLDLVNAHSPKRFVACCPNHFFHLLFYLAFSSWCIYPSPYVSATGTSLIHLIHFSHLFSLPLWFYETPFRYVFFSIVIHLASKFLDVTTSSLVFVNTTHVLIEFYRWCYCTELDKCLHTVFR